MTNKKFAESDKKFIDACEAVGLPNHITVIKKRGKRFTTESGLTTLTRQASKWKMKKGRAYKDGR